MSFCSCRTMSFRPGGPGGLDGQFDHTSHHCGSSRDDTGVSALEFTRRSSSESRAGFPSHHQAGYHRVWSVLVVGRLAIGLMLDHGCFYDQLNRGRSPLSFSSPVSRLLTIYDHFHTAFQWSDVAFLLLILIALVLSDGPPIEVGMMQP
jgi:hypothetical protein